MVGFKTRIDRKAFSQLEANALAALFTEFARIENRWGIPTPIPTALKTVYEVRVGRLAIRIDSSRFASYQVLEKSGRTWVCVDSTSNAKEAAEILCAMWWANLI